jgi:Flp pilus assembly pilin Flp
MHALFTQLYRDEAGFIVSAELVLVATISVLGLVVGLSEVSHNVNQELEDVGSAFASINQTYRYSGACGHKGHTNGGSFHDCPDFCAEQNDIN